MAGAASRGLMLEMLVKPLLSPILRNDALTRGLADPEARLLVEWLVDQVELLVKIRATEDLVRHDVDRLCRRARAVGRFVILWCYANERGAAIQLAASERFRWPLPCRAADPCGLMQRILTHEGSEFAA
jgi:hypothetical protein